MKRILIPLLKYGVSFGILGFLLYQAWQADSFASLSTTDKNWPLLGVAYLVALAAVCVTHVRWFLLVRALNLPFTIRDAFRLGFIGYFFNFLSLGVVGGDMLKAYFIARQQAGRRAEAVATVVIDRVIGLYALLVVASAAYLLVPLDFATARSPDQLRAVQVVSQGAMVLTAIGAVGFVILLGPVAAAAFAWLRLGKIPKIGPLLQKLIAALRIYQRRLPLLAFTLLMSAGTHAMFTVSVFLIAVALGPHPDLGTHFVIVPMANVAGAVPLPAGLGAFEGAMQVLYDMVGAVGVPEKQGLVIALAFRLITILIAFLGMAYYLSARKEFGAMMKEAGRLEAEAA